MEDSKVVILNSIELLRSAVKSIVVGKDNVVDLAITAILCGGHILTEDVPGIGKTTLARAISGAMDFSYGRVQFTPDLMPSDIVGLNWFNQQKNAFEFRTGPIFNQIILADEINRATPRTQSALLEAMQEGQVTIDGESKILPAPFIVIATQNPIDMEGTFPLPEAQLDRFMMRISLGYPSALEEELVVNRYNSHDPFDNLDAAINLDTYRTMSESVNLIQVSENIRSYLISIVRATRDSENVRLGASPRGSIALYKASQAYALISGRDFVIPDDVKLLSEPVLAHRIILSSNASLRGITQQSVIQDVLETISVPIEY
jgi:MoxR-like ATPase